jgi:hypothetical protein
VARIWRFIDLRLALLAATLVVAALAPSVAHAARPGHADLLGGLIGGSCPFPSSKVFAPWGDNHGYYLAPNGGLEAGSYGWKLSGGASVVSGNEPFYASGSHSLSLPSGSSATSPVTCIGPSNLAIRMFGSDAGGTDGGLRVRVTWYGLLNTVLGISDYNTFKPGGAWYPTASCNSSGGFNLILPLLGSTSARVQLTPIGSGSKWKIDDLYVDPWESRGAL